MRVSFLIPWFGEELGGGAERLCYEFATRLARAGHDVEVITTCCRDHDADWNTNHWPAGESLYPTDVRVRRFPVDRANRARFTDLNRRLLYGEELAYALELEFFEHSIRSQAAIKAVARAIDDRAVVALPYPFGLTFDALRMFPGRVVLWPCLHDEPYARMKLMAYAFQRACAVIFNSEAERALAKSLYGELPPHVVVGMGCDLPSELNVDSDALTSSGPSPLLYLGRRTPEKGLLELAGMFEVVADRVVEVELHLAGKGDLPFPISNPRIRDLGFLAPDTKQRALRSALALVVPSQRESFSIVAVEALAHATPVLCHARCAPVRQLIIEGQCGFAYENAEELAEYVAMLITYPQLRARLGQNGRDFVRAHFAWDRIVNALTSFLREVVPQCGLT